MPDVEKVEKVINGLEDSLANNGCGFMDGVGELFAVSGEDLQNAIALLKAQEPVEPVRSKGGLYHCGGCGEICVGYEVDFTHSIIKVANYCHKCGRKVMWNA